MASQMKLIVESNDLKRLSKDIRTVGNAKKIRKDLTAGLRTGAKPAVARVRGAALSLPAHSRGHSDTRRLMAAATRSQVRTAGKEAGVTVGINRRKMADRAAMPKVTNDGHWRHPVFKREGRAAVWVTQYSVRGWFDRAVKSAAPGVQRECKKVLDQIEKALSHH
jgi:hypothetical protein